MSKGLMYYENEDASLEAEAQENMKPEFFKLRKPVTIEGKPYKRNLLVSKRLARLIAKHEDYGINFLIPCNRSGIEITPGYTLDEKLAIEYYRTRDLPIPDKKDLLNFPGEVEISKLKRFGGVPEPTKEETSMLEAELSGDDDESTEILFDVEEESTEASIDEELAALVTPEVAPVVKAAPAKATPTKRNRFKSKGKK